MKQFNTLSLRLGAIGLVTLLLWGCGSGGDGTPSGTVSGSGGASGSAAASGTITGFGSVFVNGKKFETDGATFTVDGQSGSQGDLKLGMTVTVSGSFSGDRRSANTVRQEDAVEGVVQSVATDGLSLVVLGQTVLVDNNTIIDNNIPGQNVLNLVPGTDSVEVNGHIRPNGIIQATFIERKLVGVTPEVHGFVSNHVSGTSTFRIGNLTVSYAGAVINDMPVPNGSNWNGLLVEAKGTVFNAATTTLTATKVEPENQGVGNNVDDFEVEGFVTQVLGPGDFFISNTRVQTTSSTEFRGGTIDEIVVGAKVSAEGRLVNGILIAKHVKFHESERLEGNVATVGASSFTIAGLQGVIMTVNSQTEFKDVANLGQLASGNHVRIRGRVSGATGIIATRVELRSADDDVDLQGPVQAAANPTITILGVAVNTAALNDHDFQGLNDQPIGRAAFFSAVKVGTLVKVQGRLTGGIVAWREAELED